LYPISTLRELVLPGFAWVPQSSVSGIKVQPAAEEVDSGLGVLLILVPASLRLIAPILLLIPSAASLGNPPEKSWF